MCGRLVTAPCSLTYDTSGWRNLVRTGEHPSLPGFGGLYNFRRTVEERRFGTFGILFVEGETLGCCGNPAISR